jgi:hypothetical protein
MPTMVDLKAKRTRRSFTEHYKQGAVRLVLDEGRNVADVARDHGLTELSLRNGRAHAKPSGGRRRYTCELRYHREWASRRIFKDHELLSGVFSRCWPSRCEGLRTNARRSGSVGWTFKSDHYRERMRAPLNGHVTMELFLRLAILLLVAILCVAGVAQADDWTVISHDQGIAVYRRDVPGSHIVAFKGTGTIESPLWKIASILLDTKRAPEWADSLKESRVVRRLAPNAYIEYNHLGLPLIIRDRDFVSEVHIEVNAEAKTFALIYQPTHDPNVSITHYVRGEIIAGTFRATSLDKGQRTELTAELQCDPKGAIPGWLANFFQRKWPQSTFQALRKQASKPDIAMPDAFKDVLAPTRQF